MTNTSSGSGDHDSRPQTEMLIVSSSSASDVDDVPEVSTEVSTEEITQTVRSYVALAGHGSAEGHRSADEVAALFAEGAIFESSPGGDVHRGIEAIRTAYHAIWDGREQGVDLVSLTVTGGEATVHLQVVLPDRRIDATDVMTFDQDAKISSLRTSLGPSSSSPRR